MPVGNEGAGVVVAAGARAAAQALLGKTVAVLGGAMYAQYRCVPAEQCLRAARGRDAGRRRLVLRQPADRARHGRDDAARGPHGAGAHRGGVEPRPDAEPHLPRRTASRWSTSCASPSRRSCCARSARSTSCDASAPTFMQDLTEALAATGATLAFDAIGGGKLAGQILGVHGSGAQPQARRSTAATARPTHKQVYIYGGLDTGPTEFNRNFGMAWGMGGWLLFPFLQKIGPARRAEAEAARRRRAEDDLREPLHAGSSRWPRRCSSRTSPSTTSAPPARSS